MPLQPLCLGLQLLGPVVKGHSGVRYRQFFGLSFDADQAANGCHIITA
jgi:hypothetical protein